MSRTISVFRSSVRSHATHAIGELKNPSRSTFVGILLNLLWFLMKIFSYFEQPVFYRRNLIWMQQCPYILLLSIKKGRIFLCSLVLLPIKLVVMLLIWFRIFFFFRYVCTYMTATNKIARNMILQNSMTLVHFIHLNCYLSKLIKKT